MGEQPRYRLLERIGRGGMAEVFRAVASGPHGFEKVVAIKRVPAAASQDPRFVERLIDEARLAARLTHANIVQVFDFGMMDDGLYIAMELVDGLDLRALRRARGRLQSDLAVAIVLEVLAGLQYAHEATGPEGTPLRIVHCDVSPSNVLLSWSGDVKLADFGVARAELPARGSHEGQVAGKLPYMAPEQLAGDAVDHRADLYAVGCVLYELIAGRLPRTGERDEILKARSVPLVAPSSISTDLPPALDGPVLAALAPSAGDRPASAAAMIRTLVDARRLAGISDDPLLIREALADMLASTSGSRPRRDSARTASIEPTVRSLAVPDGSGSLPPAAHETRVTAVARAPIAPRMRRRWPVLVFAAIAVASTVALLARTLPHEAGGARGPAHGSVRAIGGGPQLERAARQASSVLSRALQALPASDAPGLLVTGVLRGVGRGARLTIEAVSGPSRSRASETGVPSGLADRAAALATRAAGEVLHRPVLLPGPRDPPVAAAHTYNQAARALGRWDTAAATRALDDVLVVEPSFEEALYLRVLVSGIASAPMPPGLMKRARQAFANEARRLAVLEVTDWILAGRFDRAEERARTGLEAHPDDPDLTFLLGESLLHGGRPDAGLERLRSLRGRGGLVAFAGLHGVRHALAVGDRTELDAWLAAIRRSSPGSPHPDRVLAWWTAARGSDDDSRDLARGDLTRIDEDGHLALLLASTVGEPDRLRESSSLAALSAPDVADRARAATLLARLSLMTGRVADHWHWLHVARRNGAWALPILAESALAGVLDPRGGRAEVERELEIFPGRSEGSGAVRERPFVPDRFASLWAVLVCTVVGIEPPRSRWIDREIDAVLEGLALVQQGRIADARAVLARGQARPTDGYVLPALGLLRAWLAREERRPREVLEACAPALRPPADSTFFAAALPRCLRWSAEAARIVGDGQRAAALEARLARLWAGADRPIEWLDGAPFSLVPQP